MGFFFQLRSIKASIYVSNFESNVFDARGVIVMVFAAFFRGESWAGNGPVRSGGGSLLHIHTHIYSNTYES